MIKNIVKEGSGYETKFLALSGTRSILADYDDNIYTWDYVMEQAASVNGIVCILEIQTLMMNCQN